MQRRGFTIVELLIVVVVIAILAAITLVAYSGIREQAAQSAMQAGLSQGYKAVELYKTSHSEKYPTTLAAAGLASTADVTYTYTTANNDTYYCLASQSSAGTYFVSSASDGRIVGGSCSGLVGWWPLNQDTSDHSALNYASTATGISQTTGQNAQSGAYNFSTGNITVSGFDHGVLQQSTQATATWSFSVWAKATATPAAEATIMGRSGCHAGIYTYNATLAYTFAIKTNVSGNCWSGAQTATGKTLAVGEWVHLVATYNAGAMSIYANGALADTQTFSATMYNYPTQFFIGGINSSRWFLGSIDDARVYNRVLTPGEVTSIYNGGAF